MTTSVIAVIVAALSLLVSGMTLWLTVLRRGRLKMTQPTVIFFGPDGGIGPAKIFVRTLLYSTGHKGHLIDNMFLRVTRGETSQNFNIWVCGEHRLSRGSGLHVGPSGIALNHHFLHPKDGSEFVFLEGSYRLQIYATTVGRSNARKLHEVNLTVSANQSNAIRNQHYGVYFDWGPDSQQYHAHIDTKPNEPSPRDILGTLLGNPASEGPGSQ